MMNFPEGHKLRQDLKKFIRSLVFIVGIYVFNISNAAAALTANNDIYGIPMNVISTPNTLTVETLGVLANDAENGNNLPDPPGVLTAVLVSGVSSGTLTCSTNAALQLCPDGSFNYRPDVATFQGVDSFTYNLVNSSTSETSPVPATVTLTACNTTGTVTTCWHETPYLEMLATLGYNMFRESFEGSIWNTVRSPNAAASVTSKNISWTTNHTATNVLTTSVDVARSGSWGVYDQDHGFSDGTPGVCDVNNPPANCFPYDGFTGSGTSLNAVGGYISGNAAGNISILLDGIQTDIGKSPSAGHQFFGIIDTAGFSTFQFREMDGKIGQTFSIFGDDFVIGTTAQTDTNIAPVLTAIGNQTVNEGVSFAINLSATDSNDGDTWSFSADALPAGASFVDNADGSARFNWIPGYTQQGTYTVTFTVTDNGLPALSHSETITIIVNDINRSPYLYPIGNKTVDDGVLLSFQLRATDADGNGLSFTSTALPAGATLVDNTNGTASFNWTPTASQVGTSYPITFTVTDNGLPAPQSDSESINILVTTPDIVPPVVTAPASIIVPAVNAAGAPSSHPLITAFLSGASAQDDIDGVITNITNNGPVQYLLDISTTVVFSATDSSNNTGTASATVTVSDLSQPVITLLGSNPLSINEGTVFSDPGSTVSDNVDTGLVATVTGSVNANVAGSYTLNYNVSDSAGNAATQVSRTVNVRDITRPVISLTGQASITLNINAVYSDQGATASDNVDGNLTTSIIMSGSVDTTTPGVYILTYNVSDSAGNAAIAVTRSVTVQDAAAPVVSPPASITVAATDATGTAATDAAIMAFLNGASAIDDVDTTLTISNNAPVQFPLGVTSVVFSATDSANNIGSASAAVTVSDLTRPVITLLGSNPLSINEGTVFSDPGSTVSDNVDTGLVATVTGSVNANVPGSYTLNYNVSDSAGNAATQVSRTVNVRDITRPVITLLGSNPLSINEGTVFSDPGSTVSDNVDTGLVATVTGSVNANVAGSYTLNYNVSDSAGNAATQVSRTVNVRDITRPVISLTGQASITLNINAAYSDQGATASDNVDGNLTTSIIMSGSVDTTTPGVYILTYNVSDSAGNAAIAVTRSVTVQDAAAPVVSPPASITVAATDATGTAASDAAIMAFLNGASAIDDVDTTLTISNNAPVQFPLGVTSVVFSATDSANNIGSASAAVTVSDLTRPVITLLGSNPLSINEGTVFSDPGTTVSDNVDTGLVATVTGSVNNSIVGIYTLNYNVVDAAGNAAITQTREVHVVAAVDTTPPVIDLLGVNPVSIEQGMLYDDAGATASDNVDTTITVITSGTVNTSVVGSYTLSYNATDSSGNAASTVTRIVHVTLDATSPTISLLGNNPESVEQGSLYLDAGATANDNFDGDITADIVVNNSVDTSRVGNYTVTYNVSDAAGNQALQATRTVHVTAPPVQNQAPVVIAPVDIVVAATGSVTSVNLGQAQVSDDHDTALVASANNPGPFKPGRYEIVWSATDSGNLTDTAVQVLEVQPIAEFMPDQYVESGHSVNVRVALNGQAAVYPVTIYYDVTTNGISIPGAAGSLAITQGSVGVINYTVPWHIQTGDITFNMTAATNAVIGAQSSHVISIISDNMEPLPLIEVTQNGKLTRIVTTDGGAVTVKAIVSDSNAADSHSYDWSKTDNVLLATSPGANDAQFLIDPASLTEQFYKIGVKVTDSGVPALDGEFELYIKVLSTAPVLSASDSDGDGVNDDVEGIADDDQDGIPNYIDGVNIISLLQGRVGDSNKWLINVQSGLGIRLGQFSLLAGQHNANISAQDIQNRAGSIPAAIANATDDHNNVGGYFDFEITGLSRAGQSVQLVIPLYAVIPENAVYRKYSELNGWSNFVENNHNKLYSAPGQAGVCPAPGSSDYTEGLAPGSYCVQLLIEDGGPNDSDAKRNGSIADPGGIGVKNTTPASTPGSGGGGSVLPVPLLLLLILYVMGLVIRAVNTWPLKKLKLYRCI